MQLAEQLDVTMQNNSALSGQFESYVDRLVL